MRTLGTHMLGANSTYTQRLNLSEWHDFRDIGGYAVNVALVPQFGPKPDDPLTAYFNVKIGPRDESKLRAVTKALADRAINGRDSGDRDEAALALSTVADPVAIPEMARVLASGSQAGFRLTMPLARTGGPAAADALEKAAQSNPDEWNSSGCCPRASGNARGKAGRFRNCGLILRVRKSIGSGAEIIDPDPKSSIEVLEEGQSDWLLDFLKKEFEFSAYRIGFETVTVETHPRHAPAGDHNSHRTRLRCGDQVRPKTFPRHYLNTTQNI